FRSTSAHFGASAFRPVADVERTGGALEQLIARLTRRECAPMKDIVLPIVAGNEAESLFLDDAFNLADHQTASGRRSEVTASPIPPESPWCGCGPARHTRSRFWRLPSSMGCRPREYCPPRGRPDRPSCCQA